MIIENNPKKKYKKIAVIVLVVAVLGWLIYQQMTINSLRKVLMPTAGNPATGQMPSAPSSVSLSAKAEDVKQALMENEKSIHGVVKSVSGNNLAVEADIVDFSKFGGMNDEDLQKPVDSLPTRKKTYSVLTSDKTEFLSKKLGDIKQGDSIQVDANEAIYATKNITAAKIADPAGFTEKESSANQKFISGKAVKFESNILTVTAITKDGKESGTYAVNIVAGTKFMKQDFTNPPQNTAIKIEDIKPGDTVTALTASPIGDRKAFEATQVILMILPPKK